MAKIEVALGERSYPVIVESGLASRLPAMLEAVAPSQRYFVITDQNVWRCHGNLLPRDDPRFCVFSLAPGERSKNCFALETLWTYLLEGGVERSHVVVAFGGGVVGDLAGFAAATILRGIRIVQVPTSLLAQVDAAIGGKTGINHLLGKNLLGAFHQPVAVLADPFLLGTLPEPEFQSGMYEVIKYSLIEESELYDRLVNRDRRDDAALRTIIELCVRCKAAVVSGDEREGGRRKILNFGHTLGHALEAAGEYGTLTHGQAVGLGMIFAARLARALDLCDDATGKAIRSLVLSNGELPSVRGRPDALMELMRHDKKVRDGRLAFVLPTGIGKVVVRDDVPPDVVREQLEGFLG